jgi:hypothetical protein
MLVDFRLPASTSRTEPPRFVKPSSTFAACRAHCRFHVLAVCACRLCLLDLISIFILTNIRLPSQVVLC